MEIGVARLSSFYRIGSHEQARNVGKYIGRIRSCVHHRQLSPFLQSLVACFLQSLVASNLFPLFAAGVHLPSSATVDRIKEVSNKLFDDVSALFHHLDNGMLPINVPIPVHQARKKLADIFASIIASGKKANDLLQCFIDSKYKDGRPTSESEFITGLLLYGQHTSSITSTWTGAYFYATPNTCQPCWRSRRGLCKYMKTRFITTLEVLYKCIKKALRLHPPSIMLLPREDKGKEGNEYDTPKGHIVATSPAFANRLPRIYKDPERFAPRRDEDKSSGAGAICLSSDQGDMEPSAQKL
ncbi:hypothetical protein SASPL_123526 [Salvia splendens]|uniref:Uncharacterized protein n=1 Tax=Salvia splendens TaxID=180675 RepID=A0A8X8ZS49_SALSN|nr:hypothetical protein SASPL_123526 [Salvia splendens]